MLLYTDPIFLQHDTGSHPEKALRLSRVGEHLQRTGLPDKCDPGKIEPVSLERLARVHKLEYASEVEDFAANHGGYIETDTVCSRASYDVALKAAGAVCDAVTRVVGGDASQALCLVRPPGHHALQASAMGFCLFNNVAIAARVATAELGLDRVLVVDWDVHHGNGTQDAFWEDEQVGFFSIHRSPFYPGTGSKTETGGGKGLGTIMNLPTKFGTSRQDFLGKFTTSLEGFAKQMRPNLILVSAGFDAHRLDPVGSLGLEVEDFAELTKTVQTIANDYCDGKIVSVLEGGYNVDVLPLCVETHLKTLGGWE
jgi:acetoin utilization deacetylase AcuC-like enzyme